MSTATISESKPSASFDIEGALKTSAEWQKLYADRVIVFDADGWPRTFELFDYAWNKERITEQEFLKRVAMSTCQWKSREFLTSLSNVH